ncbi:MAG: hypothetical protein HYZ43_07235 [Flavobacteriia bacterium]|nr:hypothetical protein [Flavobacteriia bacterium]
MNSVAPIEKQPQKATTNIIVDSSQRSWWNSLSDGQRKFIATLSVILGVSLISLIAFYFIRRQIRNIRSENVQNKSFGVDKHATWAKQFKQAFDNDGWWGTDVPLVRQTMRAIPSKEDFYNVQKSYKLLYKGANLIEDMSDELTKLEYEEMLAIKNAKPAKSKGSENHKIYDPTGWAKRIHAALNYTWVGFLPGTDEEAIKAVFQEFPNQNAFYATAKVYRKLYAVSLWTDLDGDLNWSLDWRALLKRKPKK